MERFTNSKNVNDYDFLSSIYDELLQDEESLSLWLKYIEEESFNDVLELASGSGVMSNILKQKGYNVIASDISEKMKQASLDNFDGEYLILNMCDYNLNKKFDLILCICDSINYLNTEELSSFFKCAYNHLNKNGRIIFDMHSLSRIQEFKEQYIEEGIVNDIPYQWAIQSDEYEKIISEHFTFYLKDAMIQENHTQNVFEPDLIKELMKDLFEVKMIDDFVEDEKVLIIGRKK